MKEQKDIDKLFKDALDKPDIPFNEHDWEKMDEMLRPKAKDRILPFGWWKLAAGIAAMFLLLIYLIYPKTEIPDGLAVNQKKVKIIDKFAYKDGDTISTKLQSVTKYKVGASDLQVGAKGNLGVALRGSIPVQIAKGPKLSGTVKSLDGLGKNRSLSVDNVDLILAEVKFENRLKTVLPIVEKLHPAVSKKLHVVLGFAAAPDLTTVQQSGSSSLSGGVGLEASVFLTKKLSLTTGAAYAKKVYDSDFSMYNPNTAYVFSSEPTRVSANCDVIDIPINVNYKLYENYKSAITISTGLSSYLMLKEKYSYSYRDGKQGPKSYQVSNQNQHYLGIANIGIEFQHKINGKLSLSAKPFMKIPLTDIGYGNARLSSTGISLTVNMDLLKKK